MSVYDNMRMGQNPRNTLKIKAMEEIVEESLRAAAIWDEGQGQVEKECSRFSGGQQQSFA